MQAGSDGLARGQQRLVVEARVGGAQPGDRRGRSSPAPRMSQSASRFASLSLGSAGIAC